MAGSNLNDSVTLASTSIPSLSIMYPGQKVPPSSDGGFDDGNNNAAPAAPATLQQQQQQPQYTQQPQQPYTSANPQIDALLGKAWETTQTANAQLNQHFSQQQQQQPILQPALPTPLPLGTAPPADLTSESLLLQQQLARQTDEMQLYLQTEMAKLSTAIRQTAASIPEPAASPLQYTASAAPQPPASPLTSLADVTRIREAALSSFASQMATAQHPGYPLRPGGGAASPVGGGARSFLPSASPQYHHHTPQYHHHTPLPLPRRTQILTVEEAQQRLNSPIWDAEAVGNRAASSRPLQGAAVGGSGGGGGGGGGAWDKRSSVSTATTSFPTVHMFDSVRSEPQMPQQQQMQQMQMQQSVVLNPPSTSTASDAAAGNGNGNASTQTLVAALKHSLNHPTEAPKAMGYAQMLAGIDAEKVVDVVHSYAQHLNRKEVSLTWRALVSQYQAAAAKGQPRTATLGGPQGAPHGHHGEETAVFEREEASMDRQFYEQDDSLPPTPKSSLKDSELSQEFQNDGYGTALKEVMSFIDKPLSPRTMARMEKIRQKTEQYGTSQSPARAPAGQQAPPAMPNASPTAQVFAIPLDAPPAGFPNL